MSIILSIMISAPLFARPILTSEEGSALAVTAGEIRAEDEDRFAAHPFSITNLRLTRFLIVLTLPPGHAPATVLLPTNRRREDSDGGVSWRLGCRSGAVVFDENPRVDYPRPFTPVEKEHGNASEEHDLPLVRRWR